MKYLNETGLAHLWASLKTLLQGKQDKLTAGSGIDITDNVISSTGGGTSYTAGNGIDIDNGEISSTIQGIPTAPVNDGTYMLKCVVSSGTPTYSWESITVGGSY